MSSNDLHPSKRFCQGLIVAVGLSSFFWAFFFYTLFLFPL